MRADGPELLLDFKPLDQKLPGFTWTPAQADSYVADAASPLYPAVFP